MEQLKPCPFCGGEAKIEESFDNSMINKKIYYIISCELCYCSTNGYKDYTSRDNYGKFEYQDGKQKAIDSWNNRVKE